MRKYELVVVLQPDLEAKIDSALTKVRGVVTDNGGSIIKEDNWGKKRLAYRINKEEFGVYVYMDVELPAEVVSKVNGTLNITDEVMRFLLVSVDEKARAAQAEAEAAAKEKDSDNDSEEE